MLTEEFVFVILGEGLLVEHLPKLHLVELYRVDDLFEVLALGQKFSNPFVFGSIMRHFEEVEEVIRTHVYS